MVILMNKEQYNSIKSLFLFYSFKQFLKALIVDFYFFVITGGVAVIVFINIIPMMVRFLVPGLILLYVVLVLLSYLAKTYFVETLLTYKKTEYIHFQNIKYLLTMIYSVVIMAVMTIVFVLIS